MNYPNNTLKEIRKIHRFNQAHMAYFLGIGIRSYREKENGHESFNQFEMIKMMLLFNLDMEDIFNLFFDKKNNNYLYLANNLFSFDRKQFIEDFRSFSENNPLFTPWERFNRKASLKRKVNATND